MRAIVCLVAAAFALLLAGPANAWWSYAQWGLNESQIMTASSGQAVPCRQDAPECATTPNGNQRRSGCIAINGAARPSPRRRSAPGHRWTIDLPTGRVEGSFNANFTRQGYAARYF
jgi:hypothetical protein